MEPRIETRPTAELGPAVLDLIARHRADVDYGLPDWGLVHAEKTYRTLAWLGDELAAHVGIVPRTVDAGGQTIEVAGISGVWTVAAHRGRGVGSRAVRAATDFARDELGAAFGLLLCRPGLEPFYVRLGWHAIAGPVTFEGPDGPFTWPLSAMVLPLRTGDAWPAGPVDLNGLPW